MIGDVQPLGEYPAVDNWLGVIKAIDHLRDTALTQIRELHAQVEELLRENVALTAQLDYARTGGSAP